MKFVSTRKSTLPVSFSESLLMGLAPDGGLLIPENFPAFSKLAENSFLSVAKTVAQSFAQDDELSGKIESICEQAFNFPIVLKKLKDTTSILELFHGPTCAFKDVGARFLASAKANYKKLKSKT